MMDATQRTSTDGLTVNVYKNWNIPRKTRWKAIKFTLKESQVEGQSSISSHSSSPADTTRHEGRPKQKFAFVNSSSPGIQPDVNVRKFVRKHVRNDFLSKTTRKSKGDPKVGSKAMKPFVEFQPVRSDHRQHGDLVLEDPIGFPTALSLSSWPVEMTTRTHRLLSRYFTHVSSRMYPLSKYLSSNPLRSDEWFRFTLTDAAMFHAILYAGAIYLSLLQGGKDSEDSMYHLGKTLGKVKEKLQNGRPADDSTIAALSCVALGEVCLKFSAASFVMVFV